MKILVDETYINNNFSFILNETKPNFLAVFSMCCLGFVQLVKFLSLVDITTANMMIVALGIVCLIYVVIKHGAEVSTGHALLFIIAYTMCGVISYFYNGNMDLVELLWPLGYMSIGILFLNEGIPLKTSKIMFLLFSIVLLIDIIITGEVNTIGANFSRNMISVYALLFLCLVILSSYTEKKGLSLVYPIVFSLLCFAAVGRGGIFTGVLCVICFLLFDFSKKTVVRRNLMIVPITIGIIAFIVILAYKFMPEIIDTAILNFESRGIESQRNQLWNDYLSKVFGNILDVLFGAEISGTPFLDRYNENLHNSFLMLHAKYGFFMLFYIVFMMCRTIKLSISKKNYHLLLVTVLIIFRMNFDYTNFNDCLDCALIYVLFYDGFIHNKIQFNVIEENNSEVCNGT